MKQQFRVAGANCIVAPAKEIGSGALCETHRDTGDERGSSARTGIGQKVPDRFGAVSIPARAVDEQDDWLGRGGPEGADAWLETVQHLRPDLTEDLDYPPVTAAPSVRSSFVRLGH